MTGKQMIDVGLLRHGKPVNESDARSEFLSFLNLAQQELWQADDWPFKREETTLTLVNGQNRYDIEAGEIFGAWNAAGVPLRFITPRTFRTLYRPLSVSGAPTRYTVDGQAVTEGPPLETKRSLFVFPTPNVASAGTAKLSREVVLADLTDHMNSVSRIPEAHHALLVEWGLLLMARQQNNPLVPAYGATVEQGLASMKAKYRVGEKR
jgi:hypothetical protein